jgi:hypothetical protein
MSVPARMTTAGMVATSAAATSATSRRRASCEATS